MSDQLIFRMLGGESAEAKAVEKAQHHIFVGESASLLIGSMAFVMCIFYLVNCRNKMISSTAWNMVNLAVSIFCAVLWYDGFSKVFDLMFTLKDEDDTGDNPGYKKVWVRLLQLVIWWYFILFVLFLNRNSPLRLAAYGTVGGHILGFAAIYFSGEMCLAGWFRSNPWKIWIVALITMIILFVLALTVFLVRKLIEAFKCGTKKEIDRWHDQASDTQLDWWSMCMGFLIVFFLRTMTVASDGSEHVSINGELGLSPKRAWCLVGFAILFIVLTAAFSFAQHKMPNVAAITFAHTITGVAGAFLLIFALMWYLGGVGEKKEPKVRSELGAQVYVAVVLTLICTFFVLSLAGLKHVGMHIKALRGAIFAVALAVGLSWEKVFDVSLESVAKMVEHYAEADKHSKKGEWTQIFFTWLYLLIVFPAWMLYILPKADEEIRDKMKKALKEGPLPLTACCCDEDLYDDYEDVEDSDVSGVETDGGEETD